MGMTPEQFEEITVLIVEDNVHTVSLISRILRGFGVRTFVSAADGSEAFNVLKSRAVDLVICDWNMKPVDGLRFARLVRRAADSPNPFIPLIMLTAHAEANRVEEARDSGVNEFLAKPISPAMLLARINSVFLHPREFIKTKDYFGPDRRRQNRPFGGPDRRRQGPKEMVVSDDEMKRMIADEATETGPAKDRKTA